MPKDPGRRVEENTRLAIELIMGRWNRNPGIAEYIYTVERHRDLDARKIDFLIIFDNGFAYVFQVKSREHDLRQHEAKKPHIPGFLFRDMSPLDIANVLQPAIEAKLYELAKSISIPNS